jgi:hypothetical protein
MWWKLFKRKKIESPVLAIWRQKIEIYLLALSRYLQRKADAMPPRRLKLFFCLCFLLAFCWNVWIGVDAFRAGSLVIKVDSIKRPVSLYPPGPEGRAMDGRRLDSVIIHPLTNK